jgi:hypothetical protein
VLIIVSNGRCRDQRFDALIPVELLQCRLALLVGQLLVGIEPALRLDDLERIGRRHQHEREKIVRIERDGRNQGFEFCWLEQRLIRRCGRLRDRRDGLRLRRRRLCRRRNILRDDRQRRRQQQS